MIEVEPRSADEPRPIVFRAKGLGLSYGAQQALADVDLEIPRGGVTAIVGPSGCGKSSFLACLNRLTDLVPGARVEGRLSFDGLDLLDRDLDVVSLRRRVGMIFQKPNPFPSTIAANLELALREHGVRDRAERRTRTRRALEAVGLWDEVCDRLDHSAMTLSGGQQQRLCIARALALEPEVLLLDEPTSALDPIAAGVVEELIRDLGRRFTIVLVTHNLAQARRLAARLAVFWLRDGAGRMIECGPVEAVFEHSVDPQTAAYLGGLEG